MVITFLVNAVNLGIFTHTPLPHLKLQAEYFENFPQQQKGMEQIMICFIKFQLENMKKAWNIWLFIFCRICNFSRCDGFTYTFVNNIYHIMWCQVDCLSLATMI